MAFFKFKKGAVAHATLISQEDFAMAGIEESVLRDLLVTHLKELDPERRLMVLGYEYSKWSDSKRRIDVLAIDGEGKLVVVEIKRTKDGGHAELQALRYAAMLSTHTFKDVVDALVMHRKLSDVHALRETAIKDLLEFLEKEDEDEVLIGEMPRIMLISADFSTELTTTVLWLTEHTEIEISCHTVALYPYGDDFALHFDLLLPLPQQTEYLVKVKDKNIVQSKQAQAVQRRANSWKILEKSGQLQINTPLVLVALPSPKMVISDESQKTAVYLGSGKVKWAYDANEYSLSSVTLKLCELHQIPISSGSIQGPLYWGKVGTNVSLAIMAKLQETSAMLDGSTK